MKRKLILLLMITGVMSNACSEDVIYKDEYSRVGIKHDIKTTDSIVEDLNAEIENEAKKKEVALVKESIMKKMPEGVSSGMQWKKAGKYASSFFGQWLDSWRSMNVEYFLSHYSNDFDNGDYNFDSWAKNKRTLHKNKEYIKVEASSVNLLKHPHQDIMATTFFQDYKSNNYSNQSWKRQYWKKEEDERWRIVYETEIEGPFTPLLKRYNN